MAARREAGDILLLLAVLACGVVLAGAVLAPVAVAARQRGSAQAAADAAALAAAQRLAAAVSGTDAARWDCAGVDEDSVRAAGRAVVQRRDGRLAALERVGCDVVATVRQPLRPRGGPAVTATARARVTPGSRPGTGRTRRVAVPATPLARGTLLEALVAEADRIDRLRLPYVWGGGHQSSPAPPDGPFDCSGAVSRVLQAVGYPIPTMVSRQFRSIGRPGPGRVTVWAYDGHVFLTIDGRGWGTGSPPNAGAGWLPYNRPYSSRFVARHLPEFEDDTVRDLGHLDLGTVLVGTGSGGPPEVRLVPLAG